MAIEIPPYVPPAPRPLHADATHDLSDETLLDNIFAGEVAGVATVTAEGQWSRVNEYLCTMFGYEEHELLAMSFQQVTHPEDLAAEQPYLERLNAGEIQHYRFRKRYIRKDGSIVAGLLDRTAMRDREGKVRFFVSRIRDITGEPQIEKKVSLFARIRSWFARS